MLAVVTGQEVSQEEFLRRGERIWNLQKLFNLKAGFTRKDDTLPRRMQKEPIRGGAPAGHVWHRLPLLDEYYSARGWTRRGIPMKKKLHELGIERL
jgi:aldehyde:ferredoxin oxidoreductase